MAEANFIAPARTPGWIRVLTHGLFVGAFRRDAEGRAMLEVASLKDPSPKHQLILELWDRGNPIQPLKSFPVTHSSVVSLEIGDPDGVSTYQQADEFKWQESDDRYDARWMADFERDFFGQKCGKQELGLRFLINEGLLFTLLRSIPVFLSENNGQPTEWRRIAQVMAIDIEYRTGRTAQLKVGDESTPLSKLGKFNVVLRNDCGGEGAENGTSDFTELFRTVVKPDGKPDFAIHKNPHIPDAIALITMDNEIRGIGGMLGTPEQQLLGLHSIFRISSPFDAGDASIDPCGEGFFGNSDGLDDQP
ncbi:MAG: hypothetical protein ACKVZH_13900 [Blastocatellia bacterium]